MKKNLKRKEPLLEQESKDEQKIGELSAALQRVQADFINYKRQAEADRGKLIKLANEDLMLEILPVLDNFQLAAKHIPAKLQDDNWVAGIRQIEKQLESVLESEGLSKIETIGQEFDPRFHEAIEHIESDKPADTIVEEIQSGYMFDDLVIRPARVKVSSGKFAG